MHASEQGKRAVGSAPRDEGSIEGDDRSMRAGRALPATLFVVGDARGEDDEGRDAYDGPC